MVVGANPQGVLGANDDTDRIRHIERLQFSDETVAIDPFGNIITSSLIHFASPTQIANYETVYGKYYDAVPFGTPTMTETDPAGNPVDPTVAVVVGDTLHGSVSLISDLDNLMDASGKVLTGPGVSDAITNAHYQWQYTDAVSGNWVDYAGATSADFVVTPFLVLNALGVRLKVSYVDGKGYTEQVFSDPSINVITLPAAGGNTAPFINAGTQFNGIGNTTAVAGSAFDFFTPLTSIFNDAQTTPDLLTYTATLARRLAAVQRRSAVHERFRASWRLRAALGALACRRVLDTRFPVYSDTDTYWFGPDRRAGQGDRRGRTLGHQHLHHQRAVAERRAGGGQ